MTRGRGAELARTFAVSLPPLGLGAWWLTRAHAPAFEWALLAAAGAASGAIAWSRASRLQRRLGTVASVLASYRDGDFSARARVGPADASLVEALEELNRLGGALRDQRLGSLESWALVRKVMAELDAAVLAFDEAGHVRLANEAAARALGRPSAKVLGESATSLGIADLLAGPAPRIVRDGLLGGQWELRRGQFRLSGAPHTLVVLADLRGVLRAQERDAWKRLVRVMGHEINNSLAPIASIADSLQAVLERQPRADDWEDDVQSGLSIVARRAAALSRFMSGYANLAKLPTPKLARVDVASWVTRVVALERRLPITIRGGPAIAVDGDEDQLDQLLINLVKNAVEAAREDNAGKGTVTIRWELRGDSCALTVEDDGPGVASSQNLFVPFFTTKEDGSGIGLALAREIAEAHGGDVTLRTRASGRGAEAEIRLPVRA